MTKGQELTLWDMGVENPNPESEKKEKSKGASSNAVASKVAEAKKKVESVLVGADWKLCFATESFEVGDFVDDTIPEEGVALETVREGLERAFPQFTKARTKWDVDKENKRLYPDAFAGSKGATNEGRLAPSFFLNIDDARKSNAIKRYVLSKSGQLFRFKDSVFGEMLTPIVDYSQEFNLVDLKPSFEWKLPKIPNSIMRSIIGFFRSYVNENGQFEVALRIYWDMEMEKYLVECPKQVVSKTNIQLQYDEQYTGRNSLRYLPVLEVHSHNVMRAFFSSIDDEDERAFCVYGVFGRLDRKDIEVVFRARVDSLDVPVKLEDIFEQPDGIGSGFDFPQEWRQNVTVKKGLYL